ncbi:dihydrolipoyl dehydrogenase [Rhodoferax sp.]|uniref:dihydrolipoyl dehydrogenase n=1 Tax=Rhodoferax sp. TaxID=50421 RepID=UPI0027183576|nr:dihydrolipoyl dehydrogenase [Rhodoferax sp.]MDO9145752.1 dihydrolipoyl dehydrogenase [Rhodoferax sp.]MDP1527898.1 dihydrolipoyl dehydrogenase [Rhodoferax sp.]MDP1944489.1 dihydrolipoyl dehydrogenase [Rhodoferax sp.]MDP2440137.1 dihydrolipoyl dehydrogenase [Rhodoferax sp.]MDP3863091.1 dihydrolipoyl dehydrogenase [Rhodoferax sp.]
MTPLHVDVAIVGAGTAGMGAYRAARAHTDSVLLIEGGAYGTTCARVGCMPSKLLIAAAEAAHQARHTQAFGIQVPTVTVDGAAVMARVQRERDRFVGFVLETLDAMPPGDRLAARVRFQDANTLVTEHGQLIQARRIVIATGSTPVLPPVLKGLDARLLTNENVFDLPNLPTSLAVFGPGVLGLELAQAMSRLGVRVKVFGVGGGIAGIQDPAIREDANQTFNKEFYLDASARVEFVRETTTGVDVHYLHRNGVWKTEAFDQVLAATGRAPAVAGLGLEHTGVPLNDRGVPLFDRFTLQCGDSTIFIAGDASNDSPLLHEAADQGRIAGENAARFPDVRPGLRRAPLAVVFTDPQIAAVGLNLKQLNEQFKDRFAVGVVSFEDQGRSRVMLRNQGLLKVYGEQGSGLFLGAEMFGPAAEHIGHLLAWAAQQRMTVSSMLDMPFYHPVIEEGVRTALRDLNHKLHIGPQVIARCMDCGPGA